MYGSMSVLVTDDKSVRVKFPPQEADYTCAHMRGTAEGRRANHTIYDATFIKSYL